MSKGSTYEAIVIGTSAGGLMALSAVLNGLSADYGIPVIIVQHRAKDSDALFEDVLQQRCRIRIKQADEKERIEAGFIYTAPPDYHLLVESDKTFSLSSDSPVKFSRPSIDVLFESAAMTYRDKLIGILLTGSNHDGSEGIATISRLGGLTIAQDPEEAQYAAMPQAAIDTKRVSHVWPVATIARFLKDCSHESNRES